MINATGDMTDQLTPSLSLNLLFISRRNMAKITSPHIVKVLRFFTTAIIMYMLGKFLSRFPRFLRYGFS